MNRRKRMMKDLDQDICDFIERETQDNIERGMPPEEARYAALRKFGNVTRVKEDTREVWSFAWLEQLGQDVRYGLRMLARNPGFTAVAVLTLALGIGANTAIFSLIDSVTLRMLPVERPEEILQVQIRAPRSSNQGDPIFTNPLWEQVRDRQDVFSGVFAWSNDKFDLSQGGLVHQASAIWVSGDFFNTLALRPAAGRLFARSDSLAEQVNGSLVQERLLALLSAFFGALALLLAMVGLYGTLSYLVRQRQIEIGIRMALGARRGSILGLVMRDVVFVLAGGVAIGICLSLATTRLLQGMLFGLGARDPVTIFAVAGLLSATALLAGYLPARRATKVDPMVALRYE